MGWRDAPIVDDLFSDVQSGGTSTATRAPAWASAPAVDQSSPYARSLEGAQTIGETPWYSRGAGALVGMDGSGPSMMDALNVLPAAGGAIGGAVGLGGGTAFGFGFGGIPGSVGGASLGGGAGEALRQHAINLIGARAPQTSGEAAGDIAQEAAIQGASELGGRLVGKGLTKTFAPFAKSLDPKVAAAAQRQGVELPAAALSNAPPVANIEAMVAKGLGGSEAATRYTKAGDLLTSMADQTVARASKLTDDSARGKVIADGMSNFKRTWTREKNALYKQAALPDKGLKVQPSQTVALLDDIIARKEQAASVLKGGPSPDLEFYRGLREGLTKETKTGRAGRAPRAVEAQTLLESIRELRGKVSGAHADPFAAANKGTLKKISATMDDEFKSALAAADPALAARLEKANAHYMDGLGKLNSTYGKQIHKLAKEEKYDKVAESVAKAQVSVDDIPRIMEVVGPEGTDAMRASVLARLISAGKNPRGQLTPDGLSRAMKTFGDRRLKAILLPDQVEKLQDIATLSSSLQKGKKVMDGSQTAFNWQNANPLALMYNVMGSPARKFLASPAGQKWLTTGYRPYGVEGVSRALPGMAHAATYSSYDDGDEGED